MVTLLIFRTLQDYKILSNGLFIVSFYKNKTVNSFLRHVRDGAIFMCIPGILNSQNELPIMPSIKSPLWGTQIIVSPSNFLVLT